MSHVDESGLQHRLVPMERSAPDNTSYAAMMGISCTIASREKLWGSAGEAVDFPAVFGL
jgi:hypothetical protein